MALTDIEVPERALSLIQPMGTAIVRGWKPIENRSWRPWESIVGKLIAIHASAKWDRAYLRFIGQVFAMHPEWSTEILDEMHEDRCVQSAIIGVARVTGHIRVSVLGGFDRIGIGGGIAGGDAARVTENERAWFIGRYGWTLAGERAIDPIPCKGSRGLWQIKSEAREVLRERLAVAA